MGTVTDEIQCDRCGNMGFIEFDFRRGLETIFCETCGAHEEINHREHTRVMDGGYGTYRVRYGRARFGSVGAFTRRRPLPERLAQMQRWVRRAGPRIERLEFTYQERGRWHSIVVKEPVAATINRSGRFVRSPSTRKGVHHGK